MTGPLYPYFMDFALTVVINKTTCKRQNIYSGVLAHRTIWICVGAYSYPGILTMNYGFCSKLKQSMLKDPACKNTPF